MKYVKIKAKNYNEAMMKLKMEYGDDAIPISHKYVKEGCLFKSMILAKELVELTAAIPERKPPSKPKSEMKSTRDFTVGENEPMRVPPLPRTESAVPEAPARAASPAKQADPINLNLDALIGRAAAAQEAIAVNRDRFEEEARGSGDEDRSIKKLEKEFHEIKGALKQLLEAQGRPAGAVSPADAEEETYIRPYRELLMNNDFDREECESMLTEVRNSVSRDELRERHKIEKTLKELIKSKIVTNGPIKRSGRKKIIMFIGPTGVGKTTTMAKLGALFSLRENHSVAFVTIDNYRIAATEQLKKYAEIMKIPIHVVSDQKMFREVVERERSEIIMVDTSGRSHRNELKISEIKSFADAVDCDLERILCVSANTKKADLASVFKSFDKVDFTSVIVTKVDETGFIGSVVDIADKFKKPISYFTNGQEVPDDIAVADPDRIADMILGSASQ